MIQPMGRWGTQLWAGVQATEQASWLMPSGVRGLVWNPHPLLPSKDALGVEVAACRERSCLCLAHLHGGRSREAEPIPPNTWVTAGAGGELEPSVLLKSLACASLCVRERSLPTVLVEVSS